MQGDQSKATDRAAAEAQASEAAQAKATEEAKAADEKAQAAAADEAAKKAAAAPAAEEAPADDTPRYTPEDFLSGGARIQIGYGKYVVAGALSTMEGDEFTVEEVKAAVEQFVGQPLDPDQPENLDEPRPETDEETES